MFNANKFLRDYGIDHVAEGHKHSRPGWVQVHCPFCAGSRNYHLGINSHYEYGSCWRCKGKNLVAIVQALLNCGWGEARAITARYSAHNRPVSGDTSAGRGQHRPARTVTLPAGTELMGVRHREYLEGRRFDPDWLERVYGLRGVGPVGEFKHRIIIPVVLDGTLVSYQGRDITGKSSMKYRACELSLEAVPHKETLYAVDLVRGDTAVVVEGAADAWRLGPGAVATFGTAFKPPQVAMMAEKFKRVYLFFDPEEQAQKNALGLALQLASVGVRVEKLLLDEGDPGDMAQDDADALMRELNIRR